MFKRTLQIVLLFLFGLKLNAQEGFYFIDYVNKYELTLGDNLIFTYNILYEPEENLNTLDADFYLNFKNKFNDSLGIKNLIIPQLGSFKKIYEPIREVELRHYLTKEIKKRYVNQAFIQILQPTKTGLFVIPPASVEFKGRVYETDSIEITVKDSLTSSSKKEKVYKPELTFKVSNLEPYLGEPISLIADIDYNPQKGWIREFSPYEKLPFFNVVWPSIDGLTMERIRGSKTIITPPNLTQATYNLEKFKIIPKEIGKFIIEPTIIEILTFDHKFNSPLKEVNEWYKLTSNKNIINVKPLPKNNSVMDYSGGLGEFTIGVASVNDNDLKKGDTLKINVTIKGKGNFSNVKMPNLEPPLSFKIVDIKHTKELKNTIAGEEGYINDEYIIEVLQKGKVEILPISFTFFSLNNDAYKTINSEITEVIIN